MNTILPRLKTLVQDNAGVGQTLYYVNPKFVEVVHPEVILSLITRDSLPKICIAPDTTDQEKWVATGRKSQQSLVNAYLMMSYMAREVSLLGDSSRPGAQGVGMIQFVTDFMGVVRNTRLAVAGAIYLEKPLEIGRIKYIVQPGMSDDAQMLIANVQLFCSRLITLTSNSLPGNI